MDSDITKKWTSTVPTTEHLISLELVSHKTRELSVKLPFNNQSPIFKSSIPWLRFLVQILQSNVQSEAWFQEAHRLDVERGICLGTLSYLPSEVRDIVRDHLREIETNSCLKSKSTLVDYLHLEPAKVKVPDGSRRGQRKRQLLRFPRPL